LHTEILMQFFNASILLSLKPGLNSIYVMIQSITIVKKHGIPTV